MPRRREDPQTIVRLREIWDYDPKTGVFTRKEKQRGGSKPSIRGDVGGITLNGYRLISVDGVHYLAHRLAWAYITGTWPAKAIEHINHNRLDNRFDNLREKWGGKKDLTPARVKELLDYDPNTGVFNWKVRSPRANIGDVAGCATGNGYWFLSVDGRRYLAHRLAWFWVKEKWPSKYVDHINGNRLDNRIANLRDVTNSQNTHNTLKRRTSNILGFPGVSKAGNRYLSRIMVNNTIDHLGSFPTIAQARIARLLGEKRHFGHFTTWDDKRDGVLPLGDGYISVIVRDNRLFLIGPEGGPTEITDIKEFQVLPVTEDGLVIN